MTARLVVVRHGRTRWNATGRFQGQADPPLDRTGRRQAARAAEAICMLHPAVIVSSDLRRARESAQIVAARCQVPVTLDRRLREIDLGGWTGLTRAQAAARYPEEYAHWDAGRAIRRGGGEAPAEAGARAAGALVDALAAAPGTIVAVAHGLVLQAAVRTLIDLGAAASADTVAHLANGAWMPVPITREV